MKITVETTVAASIEEVWRAYTAPEDIKHWNAASDDWHTTAATVDLRVGGVFSSQMEAKDGRMGFEFADSPKGVRVRVTFDSEPTHSVEQQRDGWQAILNNFTRHVEAGR